MSIYSNVLIYLRRLPFVLAGARDGGRTTPGLAANKHNHPPARTRFALLILLCLIPLPIHAAGGGASINNFLWIAILLLLAKISGLVEKLGQSAVLGELVMGVVLGNLALLGIGFFEPVRQNEIIAFLAELGVVILLFQIGLESEIQAMRRVGARALWVAAIGVAAPFFLGTFVVGPLVMPGLTTSAYLFLGAALTATSVGITGRIFRDLGKLQLPEAQIILGAAVIDDVIGLIILAVVSAIATTGAVSLVEISAITLKAFLFLVAAVAIGQASAPRVSRWMSKIHTGSGMKFTILISFCLIFAYLAHVIGLAPIVGAFAAGLVLKDVHFRDFADPTINDDVRAAVTDSDGETQARVDKVLKNHSRHHLEDLIAPLGHFLVPLFFLYTGMQVRLETFLDVSVLGAALAVTAVAFAGKLVSGIVAGPVDRWLVGWGMVPRGEVGLIFAMVGKQTGVLSEQIFSVIIIMVILTTLLTPPILSHLLGRERHQR